jgi:hypothetical protein
MEAHKPIDLFNFHNLHQSLIKECKYIQTWCAQTNKEYFVHPQNSSKNFPTYFIDFGHFTIKKSFLLKNFTTYPLMPRKSFK